MFPRPVRIAAAAAAALAAVAADAGGRAPRAEDHPSADSLLARLQREREQDQKTPVAQDQFALYAAGTTPLEEYRPLTDCLQNSKRETRDRERATSAILDRFKKEAERRAADPKYDVKAFGKIRSALLGEVLDLMVKDDPYGRQQVHRLTTALLDPPPVLWSWNDPPRKRQLAYNEIKKRI